MRYAEFNKTIIEMCAYYSQRGKTMEILAMDIGISKRTLQKWKTATRVPKDGTLELLCDFLKENNGGQFLRRIMAMPATDEETKRGVFPKDLNQEDVERIRDAFPGPEEFSLLCEMIIHENIPSALAQILPDADLARRASLVARYESDMKTAGEVFGLNNIYEWRDRIVKHIRGRIPDRKGDVEALGQEALDAIVSEYRRVRCKDE